MSASTSRFSSCGLWQFIPKASAPNFKLSQLPRAGNIVRICSNDTLSLEPQNLLNTTPTVPYGNLGGLDGFYFLRSFAGICGRFAGICGRICTRFMCVFSLKPCTVLECSIYDLSSGPLQTVVYILCSFGVRGPYL